MTTSKVQWDMDVRVRERNLKQGVIKPEAVNEMLASLPDVADLGQAMELVQPAVGAGEVEEQPASDTPADPA